MRLLGEPAWTSRAPLELLEWQRVEALVNVAFEGTGAAILCAYSRRLPAGIIAVARQTHPETVKGTKAVATPGYMDPWAFSDHCDGVPLPDPPSGAETIPLERPDLYWLRRYVTDVAHRARLPDEHLQRLLVAVTEVVSNAVRHGAPPIVLTMWTDPDDRSLVCQVADHGRWKPGADAGLLPPRGIGPRPSGEAPGIGEPASGGSSDAPGRFGLWAVRLLCSVVQIRKDAQGTTVRLRLRLPAIATDKALPVHSA
jgi:hypothetical protein